MQPLALPSGLEALRGVIQERCGDPANLLSNWLEIRRTHPFLTEAKRLDPTAF